MKLLYCELCGDIVSPHRQALKQRSCDCGHHTVWWVNPATGVLRVMANKQARNEYGKPLALNAWIIGLHNSFLNFPSAHSAHTVRHILDETPDSYIFKQWGSVVIRIRPGESGDTAWAKDFPNAT